MITDEDAEKAANYLRDTAEDAAEARANRMYVVEFRKTMKAKAMQQAEMLNEKLPIAAQEREAYADENYVKYLDVVKEAIRIDAHHEFMREAAQAKISAWQTMHKTLRGTGV